MTLEPPQPPTAPAPAVRPTPPTPPRIDKTPFIRDKGQGTGDKGNVETPEDMARDAVAHGSGALTKRTVERDDDETQSAPANQTTTVIPPDAPQVADTQSDYDRGQDVLREFRELDAREAQSAYNPPAQTSTEQERPVAPKLNHHDDGHGAPFWMFTAVFVIVAAFVVAKKFLFTDKPALTKAQLFDKSAGKAKAAADKVKPPPPPPKPAKLPPKKDDDKGKHFEVRV